MLWLISWTDLLRFTRSSSLNFNLVFRLFNLIMYSHSSFNTNFALIWKELHQKQDVFMNKKNVQCLVEAYGVLLLVHNNNINFGRRGTAITDTYLSLFSFPSYFYRAYWNIWNELWLTCCFPSHCSSVRPSHHYKIFLSEDSSGDELQFCDDSISAFPDSFLFSVPFEWSPLYASLIYFVLN